MMRKLNYWILYISLLCFSSLLHAVTKEVPLEELKPGKEQRQTALIVNRVLQKYHYRKVSLDDELSSRILDKYLESLDPNKSFFTQRDIDGFEKYRYKLDEAIAHGWLDPAYEIFKRFRGRVEQQVAWALELLEKNQFDFTRKESYLYDRGDAPWVENEEALRELWRKRVKNDILGLRLSGKKEEKIRETLRKRYETLRRRVIQLDAGDVFQTFLNAYTLTIEPHTAYMSPERSENFDISMRLSLQGIGAVLKS
ncbi:MAG TPA: tail-specific protease, partial [Chromatiaceae bacterium]|nr:tail-specific protease [Chromatiaceae bacterium]